MNYKNIIKFNGLLKYFMVVGVMFIATAQHNYASWGELSWYDRRGEGSFTSTPLDENTDIGMKNRRENIISLCSNAIYMLGEYKLVSHKRGTYPINFTKPSPSYRIYYF